MGRAAGVGDPVPRHIGQRSRPVPHRRQADDPVAGEIRDRRDGLSVHDSQQIAAGTATRENRSMQADYVIIGAGSAGCVLANRLTEDPNVRVLLIEAGGRDWNPYIHVPAGFMRLLSHPTLTWGYYAEPDPGTAGRPILYPRGRG